MEYRKGEGSHRRHAFRRRLDIRHDGRARPKGAAPDAKTSGFEGVVAYYAWSTSADGEYKEWKEGKEGNIPVNAGNYFLKYIIKGTDNFVGAATSAVQFKVLRATVAKPVGSNVTVSYDMNKKTLTVTGYDSLYMNAPAKDASENSSVSVQGGTVTLTATKAGTYTVTFILSDKNNYTWRTDGNTGPSSPKASDITFTLTVKVADNAVIIGEGGTNTFAGWIFGYDPTEVGTLKAEARYDNLPVNFEVFKDGASLGTAAEVLKADLPAGSYVLRASIAAGANTNAAYEDFEFTVSPNTNATVTAEFADVKNWTYGDKPHAFTAQVTVGTLTYGNAAVTVEYFTRGWNAS